MIVDDVDEDDKAAAESTLVGAAAFAAVKGDATV